MGCDQALITLTGLDFKSFHYIKTRFKPFYDKLSPFSKDGTIVELRREEMGRLRSMSSVDGLELVLTRTRTCGSTMVLQLIFGMTQTSIFN